MNDGYNIVSFTKNCDIFNSFGAQEYQQLMMYKFGDVKRVTMVYSESIQVRGSRQRIEPAKLNTLVM